MIENFYFFSTKTRNGGRLVPFPSGFRLLALWRGHKHPAEFRGFDRESCSCRGRPDPECER